MERWQLPRQVTFGGKSYSFSGDFRDILEIFSYFQDPDIPEFLRWSVALGLFYEEEVLPEHRQQAAEYLCWFLNGGREETGKPGPQLLDWQQDADAICADVNKVAGQEIRALPFVHWWTFLSWFHAIGEGQVSTLVTIRDKLRRGQKLEKWEQEFHRNNRNRVELRKKYSAEERAEQERLKKLLDG